jgi:hypothetical protein
MAEQALTRLREKRLPWEDSPLSNDPEWIDLCQRFGDRTGRTLGRYLRDCRRSGEDIPEDVAELIRAIIGLLNGPFEPGDSLSDQLAG